MGFEKTAYTQRSRKAVSLVNKLRDAGAHFQLDLPCVVVCGNQSAGKSSLLERLCGVKLPRAAGTCTKCPTEVRLSTVPPDAPGVTWRCHIKLRKEYDRYNKQLESKPTEQSFKTLDQKQKDNLHHYISAAQRALLNPETPADIFIKFADFAVKRSHSSCSDSSNNKANSDGSATPEAAEDTAPPDNDMSAFTRNVIVLEITGADVDLALIDLPGIIQTEQADNGSNVELVQDLVKHYISKERAIIVPTITCKDDIDNQQIVRLAKEADKEGRRTIGVLTKADTIEPETHDRWLPIMKNEVFTLRLGYFVVVNPSQEILNKNISQETAAENEKAFFTTDPWFSSKRTQGVRKRFGVDALRLQLSRQLVELTQTELPRMKEAIDVTLQKVEQTISELPAAPSSDATQELLTRLLALSTAVETTVGGTGDMAFYRRVEALFQELKSAVFAARFKVQLSAAAADKRQRTSSGVGGSSAAATAEPGTQQQAPQQQEEDVDFWLDGPGADADTDDDETQQQSLPSSSDSSVITLNKVRALAAAYRGRELPCYTPYKVLEVLVEQHKDRWDDAAHQCLQQVAEELSDMSQQLLKQHFGQFAAAEEHVKGLLSEIQSQLVSDTDARLTELMDMEKKHPWTQNTHYFTDAKQRFTEQLFTRLYGPVTDSSSSPSHPPQQASTAGFTFGQPAAPAQLQPNANLGLSGEASEAHLLSTMRAAGYDVSAADLAVMRAKKRQRSHEDSESSQSDEGLIDIIAGMLAYFKVSSKRVIDNVPMHVRHFLLDRFCKSVRELSCRLPMDLATGRVRRGTADADMGDEQGVAAGSGAMTAEVLMSEDRSVAEQRQQLLRQQAQLKDVRRIINSF